MISLKKTLSDKFFEFDWFAPKYLLSTLAIIIIVLTSAHWIILSTSYSLFSSLPFWFFRFGKQTLQLYWVVLVAICVILSMIVGFSHIKTWQKLLLLIALGTAMQFCWGFSQGRGLSAIRDRIVKTGHAEFAVAAVKETSMLDVAQHYDDKVQSGELGKFAPSKSPGTLLFYMVSERVANFSINSLDNDYRLENSRTFASITWPTISYLVLFAIWWLGSILFDDQTAILACLLYICIPSVNLINLHLDQVIYPLLAIIPTIMIALACARKNIFLAFAGGITFYLATYFSFGLAIIAVMMAMVLLFYFLTSLEKSWPYMLQIIAAIVVGVIAFDISVRLFFNYDWFTRYINASTYHTNWKGWDGKLTTILGAGLTNMVEFAIWIGIPVSILFLSASSISIRQTLLQKKVQSHSWLSVGLIVTFCVLVALGKTKAETARLWMFLIPYICILVSWHLNRITLLNRRWLYVMVGLILSLEFVTTYFTLSYQNFF